MDELKNFLKHPSNSRSRESLLNFRLFYDLKLAAAKRGYDLGIYTPDVDRDGFDIIFDDYDNIRKVQLKTVLSKSVRQWDIHKTMLRPELLNAEKLGFEYSPAGVGDQGGVILMELVPTDTSLEVKYHYTDVFVIRALQLGLIQRVPKTNQKILDRFTDDIRDGMPNEKITIKKTLFLELNGVNELLAIMSLHSISYKPWWHHMLEIGNELFNGVVSDDLPIELRKREVAKTLLSLTCKTKSRFFN